MRELQDLALNPGFSGPRSLNWVFLHALPKGAPQLSLRRRGSVAVSYSNHKVTTVTDKGAGELANLREALCRAPSSCKPT